jgi:tRNA G18 (ribose-2'-O)-methylase SpoU
MKRSFIAGISTMSPQFVAVLDNVRSMHNVGSIFRTADGAGAGKLYLCGMTATPPRPEIRKAALGAEEAVPWEYFSTTGLALERLREQGYHILALENTSASKDYRSVSFPFPLALVIGHEFEGIAPQILAQCEMAVSLPMRGHKTSLNVAVAFGIAAYEIAHQMNSHPR